ncbi:unnamed protein product [Kuraishia capsulata CBS 1993]|uniref:Uncharacterized protein n=1 Tax=Kuraishia capsulata CBS 1993 TaxID=1382522 RepID=W6MPF2_9ASCO|nr:uncharacterized protein KUCA_T00004552001 [Kuraishia capsulata CBS 1993]CDK28569.1 unnamed protein product [Kuraishia capsulata CBS 1993]
MADTSALPGSMISPRPLRDTLAIMCILIMFPTWLLSPILLLYSWSGPSKVVVGRVLSLFYNHKSSSGSASVDTNNEAQTGSYAMFKALAINTVFTAILVVISPRFVRILHLLAKAYVAASLASTKNKYTFNALMSTFIVLGFLLLENWTKFYFSIIDGSLESFTYPTAKLTSYGTFFTRLRTVKLFYVFEVFSAFTHSVLSVHTVLLNVTPSFQRFVFVSHIGKSLDHLANSTFVSKISFPRGEGSKSATDSTNEEEKDTEDSNSSFTYFSSVDSDKPISLKVSSEVASAKLSILAGTDQEEEDQVTPASFPSEQQLCNLNDISSSSTVVAQNFENYCSLVFYPPQKKQDKRGKAAAPKQQPVWSLIAAAKTMFSRQDIYSGESLESDFSSGGLLVAQGGIKRSLVDYIQCFICYTGENAIGLELLGASISEILVRVNGVMWYQVTSGCVDGKEYIIVGGLTPLSQYDLEIINIDDSQERVLLAKCTVSTVSKNVTLTQSKKATPLSTLQESLLTTNANVNREKLKLKKFRKEYSKRIHVIKNEIEVLKKKLYSNDKSDERNYRKILSLRQTLTKLDQDNSLIEEEFMTLFSRETELNEQYLDGKRRFETELRPLQVFEAEFNSKIEETTTTVESLEATRAQLLQKREKLVGRKERLSKEVAKIEDKLESFKTDDIAARRAHRQERAEKRQQKLNAFAWEITKMERSSTNVVGENYSSVTNASTVTLNSQVNNQILSPVMTTTTALSASTMPKTSNDGPGNHMFK